MALFSAFIKRVKAPIRICYFKFWALFESDGNHACPICNSVDIRFWGNPSNPNVMCSKCYSLQRHRQLFLCLKDKTNFFSADLRVLHFAPEHCFKQFADAPNLQYITADLTSSCAWPVEEPMIIMDIMQLPFRDDSFDVILCSHVLEHVSNDTKALNELFRILTPAGWAIIIVPADKRLSSTIEDLSILSEEERMAVCDGEDHVRRYGLDFKEKPSEVGFFVEEIDYTEELPAEAVTRYNLSNKSELLYLLMKRPRT
jgi:SAM-dependent methyltransferase